MSKHFSVSEYSCKCGCGFETMSEDTLAVADALRDWLEEAVNCNSGCRCLEHNQKVGGAPMSWHLPRHVGGQAQSYAMDLRVPSPRRAADWLEVNFPTVSYIVYNTFIHIDTRPERYTKR